MILEESENLQSYSRKAWKESIKEKLYVQKLFNLIAE